MGVPPMVFTTVPVVPFLNPVKSRTTLKLAGHQGSVWTGTVQQTTGETHVPLRKIVI
ncbi:MAG: hypothetical protein ACHQ50_07030 [Fimbriimonadales bacterium]